MTREEAEQAISEKAAELWDIYRQYNPKGYDLSVHITENIILINNEYWKDDADKPLRKLIERGGAAYDEMPEVRDGDKINSDEG